jgi:hypothetical protein
VTVWADHNRPIYVHRLLLEPSSPSFASTLKLAGNGRASINLSLAGEDTANLFVLWLYSGRHRSFGCIEPSDRFSALAKLYVLAHQRQITALCNDVVAELFDMQKEGHFPPWDVVQYTFVNASPDSSLAKLLVAWYVWHLHRHSFPSVPTMEEIPFFTARLARAQNERQHYQTTNPFQDPPETYFVELPSEEPPQTLGDEDDDDDFDI